MAKGLAIIGMIMLHLFCRLGSLPYKPLIWIGSVPLVYYWVSCWFCAVERRILFKEYCRE